MQQTADLARHAESLGFRRFWIAEHHGTPMAGAATAVVVGHVASKTSIIRVGAGGIVLPNHPPLVIAEQFGRLASLYPGRIDLGVRRAMVEPSVARALRLSPDARDRFPDDIKELQSL